MVLERIANPSSGESRFLSSSLSRSANFLVNFTTRKTMMIKPGKTFKLSKQTKRLMCSIVDAHARNAFKHAMIQAELAAAVIIKREPREARK